MGGRPSYPSRQLRRQFRTFLRERRRLLLLAGLIFVAIGLFITGWFLVFLPHTMATGYLMGAFHVFLATSFWYIVRMQFFAFDATAIHQLRGTYGETNTRDELKMAKRMGLIWGWVDSVTVESGDIDHLVVTKRGGLVAIDSKWKYDLKDLEGTALTAKGAARRARLVLQSLDYLKRDHGAGHRADGHGVSVAPVVVLWGASQKKIGEIQVIDETPFVPGLQLREWLSALNGSPIDEDAAEQLILDVKQFSQRVKQRS